MGIFSKMKDAIFGKKEEAPVVAKPAATAPVAPTAAAPTPVSVAISEVDVEALLSTKAAAHGGTLNWRTSIVDLMKVLDIDSSLDNRKELAEELGYTGERNGSAEMNIWLHKAVMRELAKHGGKIPAELTD